MPPTRSPSMDGIPALGKHVLVLLVAVVAGCIQTPEVPDHPELAARVSRAEAVSASEPRDAATEPAPRHDPSVKPVAVAAEAVARREADATAAPSVPDEPLTLQQARDLAMRYSPVLAQSRATVDAARANIEITDAAFRPTVQGNQAFQTFSSQTGYAGIPIGGRFPQLPVRGFGPGTQDFNVAEAQLKWTIFQFGKQVARHGQAVLRTQVAEFQLKRSFQSVGYEVGQAYFRVLAARASVATAERAVERAEAFRAESASQLRRGAITREEHLRVEASLAAMRQDLTDARSEEEVAIAGLNRAMGINVNAPTRVADRRRAPEIDVPLDGALRLAAANRPEIPVMVRGIRVAEEDVKIARADYLPSVSIQAGYSNVTGTHVQNANVGAAGIFVTHELYGGGRRRGQVRAAEAGVRSAIAQAQQVCDGIAYEVKVAFHGLEDARERIRAARVAYEQAVENLRLVGNRYRTGDATPAELMDARASETAAEQTYNAAFYFDQQAVLRLEFAVGAELPVAREELPAQLGIGPIAPGPPTGPSPFRPSAPASRLPGLPPPRDFGGPAPTGPVPLPGTAAPGTPSTPPLLGPTSPSPSLSRPPYESNSPYGVRP